MINKELFKYASGLDLNTEEDVKNKVILPYLEDLGYNKRTDMRFENAITIHRGRKKDKIFSDIEIRLGNGSQRRTEIVIETKGPNITLEKKDLLQGLSYAKLVSTPPARLGFATNGLNLVGTDIITGQKLNNIPSKRRLISMLNQRKTKPLTDVEIHEVESTALTIVNEPELFNVISQCKKIIETQALIRSDQSFKEMTKILLVKMNEERRALSEKKQDRFSLEWLKRDARLNDTNVLIIFKELFAEAKKQYPGIYAKHDSSFKITNNNALEQVISKLEPYSFLGTSNDIKGAVYEIFLKKTLRGDMDQYFTPRTLTNFMVKLANPQYGDSFVDPACGSGGFLIQAFEHVSDELKHNQLPSHDYDQAEQHLVTKDIWGQEADYELQVLAKINLIMHGDGWNNIYQGDSLKEEYLPHNYFDFVFENPPYTTPYTDQNILRNYEVGYGKTSQELDILFVELSLRLLKPGGSLYIVLPEGLLNNKKYLNFREWLLSNAYLGASFSMPNGTFSPFGGSASKTAVVKLIKKDTLNNLKSKEEFEPKHVFVGDIKQIGYDTGKKGYHRKPNDFDKVINKSSKYFYGIQKAGKSSVAWVNQKKINPKRIDGSGCLNLADRNPKLKSQESIKLGSMFDIIQPKIKVNNNQRYQYVKVPYISDVHGALQRIDNIYGKNINSKTLVCISPGNIYFTRLNPRKKRTGVVPNVLNRPIIISNEVYVLKWLPNKYLRKNEKLCIIPILRSPNVLNNIMRLATGSSSSRARISPDSLRNLPIPIKDIKIIKNKVKVSKDIMNESNAIWKATEALNNIINY